MSARADRMRLDVLSRDQARAMAETLSGFADEIQHAYEAEHFGSPVKARAARNRANRVLLDASPQITELCVNPETAKRIP